MFCGRHLLVAYLRRSDAARHSWAILSLLMKALRRQWPGVEIVLRGHGPQAAAVRFDVLRRETWDRARRVIVKAEHSAFGANPRFVVTNLPHGERYLYERVYCARGDMENRIKNQQLGMFASRASCMRMAANQFRILLSGLAYTLFEGLRRMALGDTELAHASPDRIRLTLLRIGAGWCATRAESASFSAAPARTRICSAPSPGASTPPDP